MKRVNVVTALVMALCAFMLVPDAQAWFRWKAGSFDTVRCRKLAVVESATIPTNTTTSLSATAEIEAGTSVSAGTTVSAGTSISAARDLTVGDSATIGTNLVVGGTAKADNFGWVGVAYTPATMGGSTNAPISLGITIPAGSIIRDGYVKAHSVLSDTDLAAAGTISLGTVQDSYAGLYAAATGMLRNSGYHQLIPDYATVGDSIYAASNLTVYVKTSVGAPTNGTWYIFLKWDSLP